MDLSKLKNSEKIMALGGIVGVISAFLPWYSWNVSVFGVSSGGSVNGLNGWWMLSFIAAAVSLAAVLLPMFGVSLPKLGMEYNMIHMILGGVTGGVPVLAFLQGANTGLTGFGSGGVSFGLFGAIAGGALILVGAFMDKKGGTPVTPQQPQA